MTCNYCSHEMNDSNFVNKCICGIIEATCGNIPMHNELWWHVFLTQNVPSMSFSDTLKARTSFHQVGSDLQNRAEDDHHWLRQIPATNVQHSSNEALVVPGRETGIRASLSLMVDYGHVLIKVGKCRTSHHTRLCLFGRRGSPTANQEVGCLLEMTIIDVSHVRFHATVREVAISGVLVMTWNSRKISSSRWCTIGAYI